MTPRLTHFAINTDDVPATQAFYGTVFGWRFEDYGPPGFVQIVEAVRQRILEAGGRVLMERFTIPGVGHLIAFEDPGGNAALAMEYDTSAE